MRPVAAAMPSIVLNIGNILSAWETLAPIGCGARRNVPAYFLSPSRATTASAMRSQRQPLNGKAVVSAGPSSRSSAPLLPIALIETPLFFSYFFNDAEMKFIFIFEKGDNNKNGMECQAIKETIKETIKENGASAITC